MATDLTVNPYYDDFDADKNFHRIMFKPSYAVQARELTQSQTILQGQVNEFGKSIYKEGSLVTGGQTTLEVAGVNYVAIASTTPSGNVVVLADWIGKHIEDGDGLGVRAYVIAAQEETETTPTTLVVKYVSGQRFPNTLASVITTSDAVSTVEILGSMTPFPGITSITGNSSVCSVQPGTFFIGGYFVRTPAQTIILDAYGIAPTYRVGLELEDSIVTASENASLLDPAAESSNYQAEGADRYKVTLTLAKRDLTSQDDSKFIELLQVENGVLLKQVRYAQYSNLEDTLARRTNDQSGSFTVRPFIMTTNAHPTYANAYNLIIEPGKAYVDGYEFETIGPTTIKAERARTASNVRNYGLTIDYQNYLDVTNLKGPIPFTTLESGLLHCVNVASIGANAVTAANTVIGSVRIRALDYQSGANNTSISTGVWRAYAFDVNVGSSITANCAATGNANTIYLAPMFSASSNAYVGVKLRITKNNGFNQAETVAIDRYNAATNEATLAPGKVFIFGVPGTMTQYRLDYELKDLESIAYGSSAAPHTFGTSMDLDSSSKYTFSEDTYLGAFLSETDFNRAIHKLPQSFVADLAVVGGIPLSSTEYYGRKLYAGQPFAANVITIGPPAGIQSAVTGSPLAGTDAVDNILVVITNPTGGTLANNQVINFSTSNPSLNTVSVTHGTNTSTWVITVPGAGSTAFADVYVKVRLPFSHTLGGLLRSKTAKTANILDVAITGGTTITDATGLVQWYAQSGGGAQMSVYANSAAWLNLRRPGAVQSIHVADVTHISRIVDIGKRTVSAANVAAGVNITARYQLNTGQKDNSYDHGFISLKVGSVGPTGNTVIFADYLAHSGTGYLTVDSYASASIPYGSIPTYISPTTGDTYELRDCIDFRPRRNDAASTFGEEIFGISGLSFETDFSYYIPRTDKLFLGSTQRDFELVQGVPSLNPIPPANKEGAMTLLTLQLEAYTANAENILLEYSDNRRYTMKDVGVLEKRIQNLEYYTSLNLVEQAAKNQEITDDLGLTRFKNGILVDPFVDHSVGDVNDFSYNCSIDLLNQELRPPYLLDNRTLYFNRAASTNALKNAGFVTMAAATTYFAVKQSWATEAISINPFNVIAFIGQIKLDPASDVWHDTFTLPVVKIEPSGSNDHWLAMIRNTNLNDSVNGIKTYGFKWNAWSAIDPSKTRLTKVHPSGSTNWHYEKTRTGVFTQLVPTVTYQQIGDKVVDVSIIPYMRTKGILFHGRSFSANTDVYPFFDGENVQPFCLRPNIIQVVPPAVAFSKIYQDKETVRVYRPSIGTNIANATIVAVTDESPYDNVAITGVTGGDDGNVLNAYVISLAGDATFLVGETSGANARISGYYHNTGFSSGVPVSTGYTILSRDLANANNGISGTSLVGKSIHFTSTSGTKDSEIITAYDAATRNATHTAYSSLPSTALTYTIGQLRTDRTGQVHGVFVLPNVAGGTRFRTGERLFSLSDRSDGSMEGYGTNGSTKYTSQGFLDIKDNILLGTRTAVVQRTSLSDTQSISYFNHYKYSSRNATNVSCKYGDPLAQTFLIDSKVHPYGIHATKVRLVFQTKDPSIPFQFQIRPVVNGFPHSFLVVPGTDIIVESKNINVRTQEQMAARHANTAFPSALDITGEYTEISFDGPVHLLPGTEYAIVCMANSLLYKVYVATMGGLHIGTTRRVSEQPHQGVLFKSQNSSTWTPEQDQDLVFGLIAQTYDPTQVTDVVLYVQNRTASSANVPLDVFYITAMNLVLPNTSVSASVVTTVGATGEQDPEYPIELEENIYFDDTLGRRVVTPAYTSFKLKLRLRTEHPDISPIIDLDRVSLHAIENKVNNLNLQTADLVVTSTSENWTSANTAGASITISGGGGSGANGKIVYAGNVDTSEATVFTLANVWIDVQGSGYTSSPTVTISGPNVSATAVIVGEDYPYGGQAQARYITRKIELADGMDAGDFRVFFTAYKPSSASISVYYKVLSADDSDAFSDKNYQLMTVITGINNESLNQNDLKEYVYAPGADNIASNLVTYGTFTSFKYFAIKIVMACTDTTKVPRIRNFRVVALPAVG